MLDPAVAVYLDAQQQRREAPPRTGARTLELTCLGKVCLARQALWRKGSNPSIFLPHCMLSCCCIMLCRLAPQDSRRLLSSSGCCGAPQAVPSDLSLAAMKKFIWRRKDDIVIEYRIMDPARPALLPVIDPSA